MCVSVHTAPQWCGSYHEHHPTDWLGRCAFDTSYIPRPGRVHVVCMPTCTSPVHTTAPTSAYPGHCPRPSLLGRSLLMTRHTADHRAQLLVRGQGQIEQGLKASVDPGEPEMHEVVETVLTPPHSDPFEALLDEPLT